LDRNNPVQIVQPCLFKCHEYSILTISISKCYANQNRTVEIGHVNKPLKGSDTTFIETVLHLLVKNHLTDRHLMDPIKSLLVNQFTAVLTKANSCINHTLRWTNDTWKILL
jgi:hypothetical protein